MKIKAAAILLDNVIISLDPPARHHNIIYKLAAEGFPTPIKGIQGFITDEGDFVDRREAANIALAVGQCEKLMAPPNLFSEDLW